MKSDHRRILLVSAVLLLSLGCSANWSVSDDDAARLVKEYYLYFREGKAVDAQIAQREAYSEECSCYPIRFIITAPGEEEHHKMFYFFREKDGTIEVSEFRSVVR